MRHGLSLLALVPTLALALLLNSIISERVKRTMQTIVYLPHFLSWVIIIALWIPWTTPQPMK